MRLAIGWFAVFLVVEMSRCALGDVAPTSNAAVNAKTASFEQFDRRATAGEPLSVVFFGGSLTWGANSTDPQRTSYRALMGQYLQQKYPKCPFTFHDAAIGGTGSKLGIFRLERDVLSRKPDLVFLDFTANDGIENADVPTLDSYECLLRDMIGRGIPVVQAFFGFKYHFGPAYHPENLPRVLAHKQLAEAYNTATGDVYPYIQKRIEDGSFPLLVIWPLDGAHPDDPGYRLFFETVRDGFEKAIADKRTCRAPEKPIFSDTYEARQRIRLIDSALPSGWNRTKTYRTSMWFDGLSSRWMDDVGMCDVKDKASVQPLSIQFTGTLVGVLGEGDENSLKFKAAVDGKPLLYQPNPKAKPTEIWPFNPPGTGTGRLLVWRQLSDSLPPGQHTLVLEPIFADAQAKGQLRIESICVAGK